MDVYELSVDLRSGVRDTQFVEAPEGVHHGVNSLVTNFQAALFRDFPDPQRIHGHERF